MSSRNTTTTSNTNTATTEPWGPLQEPLQNIIDQTNPIIGDTQFFTPPQQAAHTQGVNQLQSYASSGNYGADQFNNPLNSQTQFGPLMAGAQYDAAQGAGGLHGYMDRRGQGFDQGRADQWNQHKAAYLDSENPYLESVIANSNQDIMDSIKGQFSGAGRSLGSGAFANVAADRIGENVLGLRYADYQNRYNQERSNFENQANAADAYGYNAANQLYGSGTNTILNAAPTLDNLDTSRIAQREQVLGNRADQMLRAGDIQDQLYRAQNIDPTIQALSTPMSLLSNPATAFKTGTNTSSATQSTPNTGLLGGIGQSAFGLASLFGL